MSRVYTPIVPFAAVASPGLRRWRRAAARIRGAAARLAAGRAALTQAPIRLSRWAYLCCLAGSLVVTSAGYAFVHVVELDHELRREGLAIAAQVDTMTAALRRDMQAIGEHARGGCDETTRLRLVRASLRSDHARAFYVRAPGSDTWCGPLGEKLFHGATALAGGAPSIGSRPTLVPATRLGHTMLVAQRGARDLLLVAEIDPRFLQSLVERSPFADRGWDGALRSAATDGPHRRTADAAPAAGRTVLSRRLVSPSHDIVLEQTVTWRHVARRAVASLPFFVTAVLLLAVVAGALASRLVLNRASAQHRLWLALRKRRFEPLVQPIVEVATGRCVGGEVLMRWAHPVRGLLPPTEFIPLAEETGMIVPMSDLVMLKARDRLAPLTARHRDLYFSFNVMPSQLRDPAFAERLGQIFDDVSLSREHLLLELTEREFVDERSTRALQALRDAGYRLAIDDFGTGHSSLATLETLPLDRLKIDREFVRSIDDDTVTRPVLDSIISLAHSLGIAIIAEGVETQRQWDYLAARGVQYVQGYLVARPMQTAEFERWLDARQASMARVEDTEGSWDRDMTGSSSNLWRTAENDTVHRLTHVDPERLVVEMRGVAGLDVRDRMQALMRHPQCFVASEAVTWLAEHLQVSRRSAVRVGQRLVALGHLQHVLDEHDFADGPLFFRFTGSAESIPVSTDGVVLPELSHVLRAMRGGVAVRQRLRALVRYEDCFSGKEAVAWLMAHFDVSQAVAVWLGRELMRSGGLRHVFDDRPFADGDELYRFV